LVSCLSVPLACQKGKRGKEAHRFGLLLPCLLSPLSPAQPASPSLISTSRRISLPQGCPPTRALLSPLSLHPAAVAAKFSPHPDRLFLPSQQPHRHRHLHAPLLPTLAPRPTSLLIMPLCLPRLQAKDRSNQKLRRRLGVIRAVFSYRGSGSRLRPLFCRKGRV
jgi:hypothetical protein